jgi:hypothetical protein
MGVVTGYGTGYKNPAATKAVEGVYAEAVERKINSQISVANGDSINSVYYVGRVPSNCILSPGGVAYVPAIAGLTDFSLGFVGAPKALMADVDVHAGGTISTMSAVAVANYNQRAWQVAGLSADPGGFLDIFATLGAAATAAGLITFGIPYSKTA